MYRKYEFFLKHIWYGLLNVQLFVSEWCLVLLVESQPTYKHFYTITTIAINNNNNNNNNNNSSSGSNNSNNT